MKLVDEVKCARKAHRTNMFVMAAMSVGLISGPVKIRNLSTSGALIEGSSLPEVGTEVTLRRGKSAASGRVVWSSNGKAGIQMGNHVQVADWMPSGLTHQNSIDHLVEMVKKETQTSFGTTPASTAHVSRSELLSLADAISSLADLLAEQEDLIMRFSSNLQTLDLASQVLRKLAIERENLG